MVTPSASIHHLDDTTVLVTVPDTPESIGGELDQTLREAEALGKPALVIDLSAVRELDGRLLGAVSACQRRCIVNGRWVLVVPPQPSGNGLPSRD